VRFGKISAKLLGVTAGAILILLILRPGWGNPFAALGGLLIIFLHPAALVTGIVGIFHDDRKQLSIITTIISAAFVYFFLLCRLWRHNNL